MPDDYLSNAEWESLIDVSDPECSLIHDDETIELLLEKELVIIENNCLRPSEHGLELLLEFVTRKGPVAL